MINKTLVLLVFNFLAIPAYSSRDFHLEINAQYQDSRSSSKADELDQDFHEGLSQMNILAGDKIEFWGNHLQFDVYTRFASSSLFTKDMDEMKVSSVFFPQQIVARDALKSNHLKINDDQYEQVLLYQAAYEWGDEDVTFRVGRFPVVFGQGYYINPINPLNHAQSFSPQKLDQVNDGAQITFHTKKRLKLHLYFLGDKRYTDYNEDITRTVMIRGEWKKSSLTSLNYIIGEDQKRHKYGFEFRHGMKDSFVAAQGVRYSQQLDESSDSAGLAHYLVSLNKALNSSHHISLEFGKFQRDEDEKSQIQYNYLPFESFVGPSWKYQLSDKLSSRVDYVVNSESKASIYNISIGYQYSKQFLAMLYTTGLATDSDDDPDFQQEDLFPTMLGLNLQGKF